MRRYVPVSQYAKAVYGDDPFTRDPEFTVAEERDMVEAGHLEIVPATYRVLSDNYSAAPQNETYEAALTMEQEAVLVAGGHIERVDEPQSTQAPAKKATPKKRAAKRTARTEG